MTDRELLVLAAKAARFRVSNKLTNGGLSVCSDVRPSPHNWNPRADDGDAFRLMAKLGMHIRFYRKHVDVDAEAFSLTDSVVSESFTGSRKEEAARRAIVRAAAEIGKAMP